MTDVPMPKLPGPAPAETLGQMIDETSRLLGRVSRHVGGCLIVGYPVQVDALERKLGDVASLKALVDGLRDQVQAAEVLIGAIRDELGAKKGDDLLEALRERREMDAQYRALKSTMDLTRETLGVPHGHDLIRWVRSTNDHRRQVEAELDEVSEILSHGVDKPGTAIEMAHTLLERATAAEPILSWIDKTIGRTEDETHDEALGRHIKALKRETARLPEGQEARAVPRRLWRYGSRELWAAGDWMIEVHPRDARYTKAPEVVGFVHEACGHLYSTAYHRIEYGLDLTPAEAVARWVESVIRHSGGVDVVFGPYGRKPLLDPSAAQVGAAINELGESVAPKTAAEVNEANTLRVVSPLVALKYTTAGSSGIDLPLAEGVRLAPGQTRRLRTGIRVQIPPGFEGQIRPRSSSSAAGLYVALGTIDSDYRGEIEIIVRNERMTEDHILERGARVAQLVICPVARPEIVHVDALDETERGAGGFGSTGK